MKFIWLSVLLLIGSQNNLPDNLVVSHEGKTIVNVNFFVAKYLMGGMSKQKHLQSLKERFSIFSRYYGLIPNIFNHGVITFRLFIYFSKIPFYDSFK